MKVNSYKTMLSEARTPYLVTEKSFKVDGRRRYDRPDLVVDFIKTSLCIQNCAEEYMYCLCLDNAAHLIGLFEIAHGTVNGARYSNREILQKALLIGAVNIIVTHNHPSGILDPSDSDMKGTKNLCEACKIIGIDLLDHIIVTREWYYSFAENKLIKEGE
jgi:DNA repair protein RadC